MPFGKRRKLEETPSTLRAYVKDIASYSGRVRTETMRQAKKFCVCFIAFLSACAEGLVLETSPDKPAMVTYQSDGWSCFVNSRHVASCGKVRVLSSGRIKKEILLDRRVYTWMTRARSRAELRWGFPGLWIWGRSAGTFSKLRPRVVVYCVHLEELVQ